MGTESLRPVVQIPYFTTDITIYPKSFCGAFCLYCFVCETDRLNKSDRPTTRPTEDDATPGSLGRRRPKAKDLSHAGAI